MRAPGGRCKDRPPGTSEVILAAHTGRRERERTTLVQTRTLLIVLGSSALLLAVILATAGGPVWGWATIAVLGAFTAAAAAITPRTAQLGDRR